MHEHRLTQWLERLGYAAEADALHRTGDVVPARHQYALEMQALLRPEGAIRAEAVFDVEGVPTVVFIESDDGRPFDQQALDQLRQRLWNQNLVSVVIAIEGSRARALPVRQLRNAVETLELDGATAEGPFSASEVRSSTISDRLPSWFDARARVDRKLLDNIAAAISLLESAGAPVQHAQVLMGQLLFVSYLEHREIVSGVYRQDRGVCDLHTLVRRADREGIAKLIVKLRDDFNGDFLAHGNEEDLDPILPWQALSDNGFKVLDRFLARVELATGQGSLWNYDFSFIPVELLSGLYESFLSDGEQAATGAYYTPRHLATLAVHQALLESRSPLTEAIFDGACGSGILLTTAYRRLIALHEAHAGKQLGFAARGRILTQQIFGGDINPMACRVTAFSLYLSLMEGLEPADILTAQACDGVKLPSLRGNNLSVGVVQGDFFSEDHPFHAHRFGLIISNPPWVELSGPPKSADNWATSRSLQVPLRQLAGYYALRAIDFLANDGRLCLILPIALLMGKSGQEYLRELFAHLQPRKLFNFGDLQQLIFPTAENACHLLLARRRSTVDGRQPDLRETFEYIVPKAELSLNLGRLSVSTADRHYLQTQRVMESPELLTSFMWGDFHDLALFANLQAYGTLGDFWRGGKKARWVARKGIHFQDKHRQAVSAEPLAQVPFAPLDALKRGLPIVHPKTLATWPAEQRTVVGLDSVMPMFAGPRILFPDGFSREELNIRASYVDTPMSFNSSVGVIAGPQADADLLRFVAVYLRSRLARYFLMLTNTKMLTERNGVHLKHVEPFPFFTPLDAPFPETAAAALAEVAAQTRHLEGLSKDEQPAAYAKMAPNLDELIFGYFGLSDAQRQSVVEAVDVLMPSIRPRSSKSLYTRRQRPASADQVAAYASGLGNALAQWRDRLGGAGTFMVEVVNKAAAELGGLGIVRIQYLTEGKGDAILNTRLDDVFVLETLQALRRDRLVDQTNEDGVHWLVDRHVWTPRGLYFAKPLISHAWLMRTAQRDAEAIVRDVQSRATSTKAAA